MRSELAKGTVLTYLLVLGLLNSTCSVPVSTSLPVQNVDTGLTYSTIQQAIEAPETIDGHTILVPSGIYHENLFVNKALRVVGENTSTTIIDGDGRGTVVQITTANVAFSNFTVQNGYSGIRLYNSEDSTISGNRVHSMDWFSVGLDYSENVTLRDNSLTGDTFNFGVKGAALTHFIHDIDTSNTVNGKPIYYLMNQHNLTINTSTFSEIGFLALVNSTNIIVEDLTLMHNQQGLLFAHVTNSMIESIDVTGNWDGIHVKNSANITIGGNHAHNNFDYAIALRSSEDCTVSGNNVTDNSWGGISIGACWNTTVNGNNVSRNYYGIHLVNSRNTTVRGNNADNNRGYSVVIYYPGNNTLYHNNFDNNLIYTGAKSENMWDNRMEGNYWSNYTGIDADHDGIYDAPYILDENNKDNYPLAGRFTEFSVMWNEEHYTICTISSSKIFEFQLTSPNKTISFSVTDENQTAGFCRVAIPKTLIHELQSDDFPVFVHNQPGSGPVALTKKWADEMYTYLYFTYGASEAAIPEPWILLAISFLTIGAIIMAIYWNRKRRATQREVEERLEHNRANDRTCAQKSHVSYDEESIVLTPSNPEDV